MTNEEQQITNFSSNIRLLIQEYKNQKMQLCKMEKDMELLQKKCESQEVMLKAMQKDYESLKMARMLEVGTSDLETARQSINKLIRDVNKCITLVNNAGQ